MQQQHNKAKRQPFIGWRLVVLTLLGVFALTTLLRATVLEIYTIPSNSMEPTLMTGEKILVNRLAYLGSEPERGDLIVFDGRGSFAPYEGHQNPLQVIGEKAGELFGFAPAQGVFVKRVIAVGGDRIKCCSDEGQLLLNESPIMEEYLPEDVRPSDTAFDMELPPHRLWLMGDNRADSADSRDLLGAPGGGAVPVDRVIGQVLGSE